MNDNDRVALTAFLIGCLIVAMMVLIWLVPVAP